MIHNISNTPKEETGTKAARSIDRSATQHVRNPLQAMSYRQAKVLAVGSSRFFVILGCHAFRIRFEQVSCLHYRFLTDGAAGLERTHRSSAEV